MEESSFEKLIILSAGQEISHILWDMKVHEYIHKTQPLPSIMSQINPIHILPLYFIKVHINITLI
jgi:hypothetical protein